MLPITPFLESAKALKLADFVAQHPGYFLLKRPRPGQAKSESESAPGSFGFQTVAVKFDFDPFGDEWRIAPVKKRPGNPFPERMTVGRATNCDIILRVPFISKVHAHILLGPGDTFSIHDNGPSNRTFHKHRLLAADATQKLEVGDAIGFGSLEVEFVDSNRLYEVLRSETVSTQPAREP
jgi:pSer/pThr/pTyr-binding forkhead associated (FHA) protein